MQGSGEILEGQCKPGVTKRLLAEAVSRGFLAFSIADANSSIALTIVPNAYHDRDCVITAGFAMLVEHRCVESNGIKIHIAEAGAGPLVLLCHGFPESWYSWRHQIKALSEAGYHVIAPDMRGYGQTDRPNAIDQYSLFHLVGDMVGLVNAIGDRPAVVIGHDWGAPVALHCALFRTERFHAVAGLSVPFRPRGPAPPTSVMPQTDDEIFYQLYFQAEGIARSEFEQDVRKTVRFVLAGSGNKNSPPIRSMVPRQGGGLVRDRRRRLFQ